MINILIIINAVNPGIPNIPVTLEVIKFIGICKSMLVPKAFTKNNNSAPIITFIESRPTHCSGRIGAPTNNKINIIPPKTEKTSIGSIN